MYSSNTRLGGPYFPVVDQTECQTLEIPSTLPTWDEALANPDYQDPAHLIEFYRKGNQSTDVHTIHTEVEATAHYSLFEKQLEAWQSDGASFLTLAAYAQECLAHPDQIPRRQPTRISLPFRGGYVSSSAAQVSNRLATSK